MTVTRELTKTEQESKEGKALSDETRDSEIEGGGGGMSSERWMEGWMDRWMYWVMSPYASPISYFISLFFQSSPSSPACLPNSLTVSSGKFRGVAPSGRSLPKGDGPSAREQRFCLAGMTIKYRMLDELR